MPGSEPLEPSSLEESVARLDVSVKRLRRWVIVLVSFMVLGVLSTVAPFAVGVTMMAFQRDADVPPAQLQEVESAVRSAFPGGVDDLSVRVVEIAPTTGTRWPLSLLDGSSPRVYVQYRPRGSKVLVANAFDPVEGMTLADSGILPPRAVGVDRMTSQQFEALLAAFGQRTTAPFGAVLRHLPDSAMADVGSDTTATIGGVGYAASELWTAIPGRIAEGDSITDGTELVGTAQALVFRLNPSTQEFSFVGSEPYLDNLDAAELGD